MSTAAAGLFTILPSEGGTPKNIILVKHSKLSIDIINEGSHVNLALALSFLLQMGLECFQKDF